MSLAFDCSICDHCCLANRKSKSEMFRMVSHTWIWIYVYHRVLCQLRTTFLRHGIQKLFFQLCPAVLMILLYSEAPLSSSPWFEGWRESVFQAATLTKSNVEGKVCEGLQRRRHFLFLLLCCCCCFVVCLLFFFFKSMLKFSVINHGKSLICSLDVLAPGYVW